MIQKLSKIWQWAIALIIIAIFVTMFGLQANPWPIAIVAMCVVVLSFYAGYDTNRGKTSSANQIIYGGLMSLLITGWIFDSWPVLKGQPPINSPLFYLVWTAFFAEWLLVLLIGRAVAQRTENK